MPQIHDDLSGGYDGQAQPALEPRRRQRLRKWIAPCNQQAGDRPNEICAKVDMDYTGLRLLGSRYTLNRELTDDERRDQLNQNTRLNVQPVAQLSVVELNSTYLESVDRYYAWRGYLFFVMTLLLSGVVFFYFLMTASIVRRLSSGSTLTTPAEDIWFLAFLTLICVPPIIFLIFADLQESFTYTYFPIRLNRKLGKVFVFRPGRPNRPILVADWDKLFITLGACQVGLIPGQSWDIRAHVLAEDGKTVIDTFAFSWFTMSQENLRCHWEFLRRYMAEGAQAIVDDVQVCMPIAERRESLKFSFQRFHANFNGSQGVWILLFPLWLASILGRWVAGLTCRVPRWPEDIQAACRVDANDPWKRGQRTNP